jgi:peptidoglycan/xylan/chitin deacetylase (PgdA/CDA1 family)
MLAIPAVLGFSCALAASSLLPYRGLHEGVAPGAVWRAPPFLNLTFDDGPDANRTPRVLDLLRASDVRATFFVVGHRVSRATELTRRIAEEGHDIGNHGWDHTTMAFRSRRVIREQLERCQDAIGAATGKVATLVRPPFGRRDYRFYGEAQRLGLKPVYWSVDSGDWCGLSPRRIAARVLRASDGDIVLFHDGNTRAGGLLNALGPIVRHHRCRLPRLRARDTGL